MVRVNANKQFVVSCVFFFSFFFKCNKALRYNSVLQTMQIGASNFFLLSTISPFPYYISIIQEFHVHRDL